MEEDTNQFNKIVEKKVTNQQANQVCFYDFGFIH